MIPDKSRQLTETHFVGQQCGLFPLYQSFMSADWQRADYKFTTFEFISGKDHEQNTCLFITNIFTKAQQYTYTVRRKYQVKTQKRKKLLCGGEGAGRQYLQRSEAEQLLESINFNFIDFIVSQVSEMTDFQRFFISVTGFKD